jgi:hypothetical protein
MYQEKSGNPGIYPIPLLPEIVTNVHMYVGTLFYIILVYIVVICYTITILVKCIKKNLATLVYTRFHHDSRSLPIYACRFILSHFGLDCGHLLHYRHFGAVLLYQEKSVHHDPRS